MPLKDPEARRRYKREYYQRPGVKARKRCYDKKYRQHSYVKEKKRLRRQRPEVKERTRLYFQRPEVHRHRQEYFQRPEVKARKRQWAKKYHQHPEVKEKNRVRLQRPDVKAQRRRHATLYSQRPETKLIHIAQQARHRDKGFVPICSNTWSCPVDYHHVSPSHPYVVPLPRKVHRAVAGASRFHFAFNASMICLLYGLDILGVL